MILMALPLIDAHCHLQDKRLGSKDSLPSRQLYEGVLERMRKAHVHYVVSCATHLEDWRVLAQLLEEQKERPDIKIVPCFGIHPWWSHRLQLHNLNILRDVLTRYPTASVGEIGLCKSVRGRQVPLDVQVEALNAQLAIAVELDRACVLHCVGYHGKLLEILQSGSRQLPPVLVLHSFSGSPDMMRSFLMLQDTRVFISLNAKQLTDPCTKKAVLCCKDVPSDALLLETDAPDQAPLAAHATRVFSGELSAHVDVPLLFFKDSAGLNEPCMVKLALYRAAEIRGVQIDELAAAIYENSKLTFGFN